MPNSANGLGFLSYAGIPSWLQRRPKLPSRNWLIFWGVVGSLSCAYQYDRRQCARLKQHYIDLVKHRAQFPLQTWELPRKIIVYTAKWPGDDDYQRGAIYFKKYLKPILVAAAVDYEIISGKNHGDLAEHIANTIRDQRRRDAKLDPPLPGTEMLQMTYKNFEKQRRAQEGGTIIVGRAAFKEYLSGLHRGWTETLAKVDKEEQLAQILSEDNTFNETQDADVEDTEIMSSNLETDLFPSHQPAQPNGQTSDQYAVSHSIIPLQSPLLLLPFLNRIGFAQIPMMFIDFFNQRRDVKLGGEAALTLLQNSSRPISEIDRDWDTEAERHYKSSVHRIPADIEEARATYYKKLPERLRAARDLARGLREPTKDEMKFPPPNEVELRAERLKKELHWRNDLYGWNMVTPESPPIWNPHLQQCLHVYSND